MIFKCSCVTPVYTKKQLEEILENSKEISRATFTKTISNMHLRSLEKELGYEINRTSGMTMKDDGYVTYHRSSYLKDGKPVPVKFFKHSSIEYFFE